MEVLKGITKNDIKLPESEFTSATDLLKFDMLTEFDSQNFCDYLKKRRKSGLHFSDEFDVFERVWKKDEENHYIGYRRLLSLFTGLNEDTLHEEAINRSVDFGYIEEFLQDEFMICLVLAYDEIITVNSCKMDFALFSSMGNDNLLKWIKNVARDEHFHFTNIINILKTNYADRFDEIPAFIESLISYDCSGDKYGCTFVMDHDSDKFPRCLLEDYKGKIIYSLTNH